MRVHISSFFLNTFENKKSFSNMSFISQPRPQGFFLVFWYTDGAHEEGPRNGCLKFAQIKQIFVYVICRWPWKECLLVYSKSLCDQKIQKVIFGHFNVKVIKFARLVQIFNSRSQGLLHERHQNIKKQERSPEGK